MNFFFVILKTGLNLINNGAGFRLGFFAELLLGGNSVILLIVLGPAEFLIQLGLVSLKIVLDLIDNQLGVLVGIFIGQQAVNAGIKGLIKQRSALCKVGKSCLLIRGVVASYLVKTDLRRKGARVVLGNGVGVHEGSYRGKVVAEKGAEIADIGFAQHAVDKVVGVGDICAGAADNAYLAVELLDLFFLVFLGMACIALDFFESFVNAVQRFIGYGAAGSGSRARI